MTYLYRTVILVLFSALLWGCAQDNAPDSEQATQEKRKGYAEDATDINPVLTGTEIPNSKVRTVRGDTTTLHALVGQKPTVLIFYRGGWCPFCNKHMAELQRIEDRLVEMGYQILAVSADRPEKLSESIQKHDIDYTLLSDSPMQAAREFGLAFKVDQSTIERYRENGIDLEEASGYDHHLLPVPAVFLVDIDGMIRFQYVNPDYKTRVSSKVLLAAAEAYFPE